MASIPSQKKLLSEKDEAWIKNTVDAYIDLSIFTRKRKNDMYLLYELYNGKIKDSDYTHILDPYNTRSTGNPMPIPTKLRNFPIIMELIDLIRGEMRKRPFNFYVKVNNPDAVDIMEQQKYQSNIGVLKQMYINELNKNKVDTGVDSTQTEDLSQLNTKFAETYKDARAINGQHLLTSIVDSQRIIDKFNDPGFKDYLIAGEICTYKGVRFNELVYEIVNPLFIDFIMTPETQFGEDSDAVVRRKFIYASDIVDNFRDLLEEAHIDIKDIESNARGISPDQITIYQTPNYTYTRSERLMEVIHVTWKSFKKVGILDYMDEYGSMQQEDVDETYKLDKAHGDIDITWDWISEIWEAYRINKQHYVGARALPIQRRSLDNKSTCKHPYNKIMFSARNSDNISPVSLLAPFQFYYNIYKVRLDMLIAASKGKIALIDIKAIPNKWGKASFDKFMYYSDVLKFALIDTTQTDEHGKASSFNHWGSVLDLELKESIQMQVGVLESLRAEAEAVLGISRQRKGDVSQSARVGNTEQAISQSYTISEPLFALFETFEREELQGLIDHAKIAYRNGKKGVHVTSSNNLLAIDISTLEIMETEYQIFVTNTVKDVQKFAALEQLAGQMLSSGSIMPGQLANMLDAESFAQLKEQMKKADEAMLKYKKDMQAQAEQSNERIQKMKNDDAQQTRDNDNTNKQLDRESKERIALTNATGLEQETLLTQTPADVTDIASERYDKLMEHDTKKKELTLKEKELQSNDKLKRLEIAQKERDSQRKLKIAVQNKNKFDK